MMFEYTVLVVITLIIHELGHYLCAKHENLYDGWGIIPAPHIKLKKPFTNRWMYLSGLVTSFAIFPIWILVCGWEILLSFVIICLGGSILDIAVFIFYNKLQNKR